jgi:hypothetical protein
MKSKMHMNIGIYGGGFKPFTTGHYSKLLYACGGGVCKENDVVFLFYGIASRQKGSEYDYTKEMAQEIFQIYRVAIERSLGAKGITVHVVEAKPTPIALTFAAASEFAGVKRLPIFSFTDWGIDPADIETLTVYGERDSLEDFTRHIGTPKEEAYFGDAVKTGRLQFDPGYEEGAGDERVIRQFMTHHPELSPEEAEKRVRIRGSNVRAAIMSKDPDEIGRFLPSVLNDEERAQVIDILVRGVPTSESLIRLLIRGFLVD